MKQMAGKRRPSVFYPHFAVLAGLVDPLRCGGIVKEWGIMMDRIALLLVIIGALNWGSVGIFNFDVIAWAFGGTGSAVSRVLFALIAIAGIWCISLLFRERETVETRHSA